MAEIDKSWKSYSCLSADYVKKKKNRLGTLLLTLFVMCLTGVAGMWMSAGFCQSMARNLTVQEAAAAALASM